MGKNKDRAGAPIKENPLNNKLVRFALSRGFEMKDIRHCITLSDENDDLE